MANPFFINYGPFTLSVILKLLDKNFENDDEKQNILDIKDLTSSTKNDITFFHSKKYKEFAKITKASFCITSETLKNELPVNCKPIVVKNILISTSKVTAKFYPMAVNDNFDETTKNIFDLEYKNNVKYGRNVLVGKNVTIGSNCMIGHNTIIEKNVSFKPSFRKTILLLSPISLECNFSICLAESDEV